MPENRNFSPGSLPSKKINRHPKLRTQKRHLFSVKQSAGAKGGSISFVTVQDVPHVLAKDTINLDPYESRLFDNPRVSVLDKQKTSQHPVPVKPKISHDKET